MITTFLYYQNHLVQTKQQDHELSSIFSFTDFCAELITVIEKTFSVKCILNDYKFIISFCDFDISWPIEEIIKQYCRFTENKLMTNDEISIHYNYTLCQTYITYIILNIQKALISGGYYG